MQILAHRGHWLTPDEKNTRKALKRAFDAGFGAETDIRDLDGELVISHDMPRRGTLPLSLVLDDYARAGQPGALALNIKSDGLAKSVQYLLAVHNITRYFCFDMSVPDTFDYLSIGLNTAVRLSEFEPEGMLSDLAPALWVDGFQGLSITPTRLHDWLMQGKQVCLVSPELHSRHAQSVWVQLRELSPALRNHPNLMLCTDHPQQVQEVMA